MRRGEHTPTWLMKPMARQAGRPRLTPARVWLDSSPAPLLPRRGDSWDAKLVSRPETKGYPTSPTRGKLGASGYLSQVAVAKVEGSNPFIRFRESPVAPRHADEGETLNDEGEASARWGVHELKGYPQRSPRPRSMHHPCIGSAGG
jgi:hypothetical protein